MIVSLFPLLLASITFAEPSAASDADAETLFRALSARHADKDCAAIEALVAEPVPALVRVVEEATLPPWVPMRAARCLALGHSDAVRPQLASWVRNPDQRGLMLLVVGLLDQMPRPVAVELGRIAVTDGSDPAAARERLARATAPELRALATPTTSP